MLLRCFLLTGNILIGGYIAAQSNTVSSGGNASGTNGSVSYTLGQIDYISASGTNGNLNQGVQQPFEFYATSGLEEFSGLIDLSLGPNPTTDKLFIHVNGELNEELTYVLIDDQGKIIQARTLLELNTALNMSELPSALYQLVISSSKKEIKTYKIIKH